MTAGTDSAPVQVWTRVGGPFDGVRVDAAVVYEWPVDPPMSAADGTSVERQRSYLLLDHGIALTVPGYWRGGREQGSWYVDLVAIEQFAQAGNTVLRVHDLYLDLIVPTDGRPYRMLDLDEFGAALAEGRLDVGQAGQALTRWQRFLDAHLHDRDGTHGGRFPDFPPTALDALTDWPGPATAD